MKRKFLCNQYQKCGNLAKDNIGEGKLRQEDVLKLYEIRAYLSLKQI